jgi:hypothetical protein
VTTEARDPTQPEVSAPEADLETAKTVPAGRVGGEPTPEARPFLLGAELPLDERLTLPARRQARLGRLSNTTTILIASAALGVIAGAILLRTLRPTHQRGAIATRAAPVVNRPSSVALEARLASTPTPAAVTPTSIATVATGDHDAESARAPTTTRRQARTWHASGSRKAHRRAAKAPRASQEPARDAAIVCADPPDHREMGTDLQGLQHRARFVVIDLENPYP